MKNFTLFIIALFAFGVASAQNSNKVDRHFEKRTFINKGQSLIGSTVSYMSLDADNYKLLVLDNMKAKAYAYSVKAMAGHCIADDVAAGLCFEYSRTLVDVPKIDLKFGDDVDIKIDKKISHHRKTARYKASVW